MNNVRNNRNNLTRNLIVEKTSDLSNKICLLFVQWVLVPCVFSLNDLSEAHLKKPRCAIVGFPACFYPS